MSLLASQEAAASHPRGPQQLLRQGNLPSSLPLWYQIVGGSPGMGLDHNGPIQSLRKPGNWMGSFERAPGPSQIYTNIISGEQRISICLPPTFSLSLARDLHLHGALTHFLHGHVALTATWPMAGQLHIQTAGESLNGPTARTSHCTADAGRGWTGLKCGADSPGSGHRPGPAEDKTGLAMARRAGMGPWEGRGGTR